MPINNQAQQNIDKLLRRYRGATPESLVAVLCPLLIPIESIDAEIIKLPGQGHYRASFTVKITEENYSVVQRGRTGKFIPGNYINGRTWHEIAKGRFIEIDYANGIASGEIYTGGSKTKLESALEILTENDLLEIDQFGAAAKVLSGLAENSLCNMVKAQGYKIRRMPEDMARHLGNYPNYDFEFEKNCVTKKIEVKSLWGTNTEYARLIHSTTTKPKGNPATWTPEQKKNYYPTSSCKYLTQDIFAVSLFLRTGDIRDFAFARSVPINEKPYGLPRSTGFLEHIHQNPICNINDGTWFANIDEVWNLE